MSNKSASSCMSVVAFLWFVHAGTNDGPKGSDTFTKCSLSFFNLPPIALSSTQIHHDFSYFISPCALRCVADAELVCSSRRSLMAHQASLARNQCRSGRFHVLPNNTPGQSTSFKAGETIDVRYWRNNHLGGFIRWSIAKRGEESKEVFDKNAFYYTCRESGPTCLPKGTNTRYAGDSSGDNTIPCGDKIVLPDWLPTGDYVLQWTWFGVGSSFGNIGWAEPQFRSCADIKLTTAGTKSAAPKCPSFVGGDRVSKLENKGTDQCFYFYTNDIVNSQYKGSSPDYEEKNYQFGIPVRVKKCNGDTSPDDNSTTSGSDGVDDDATAAPTPVVTTKVPTSTPSTKPSATNEKTPNPPRLARHRRLASQSPAKERLLLAKRTRKLHLLRPRSPTARPRVPSRFTRLILLVSLK
ncbi:hypothetical protein FI667_g854, partial [Globisporangium splendens]